MTRKQGLLLKVLLSSPRPLLLSLGLLREIMSFREAPGKSEAFLPPLALAALPLFLTAASSLLSLEQNDKH